MSLAGYLPPVVAQIIMDTKGLSAGMADAEKKLGSLNANVAKFANIGKLAFAGLAAAAIGAGYESVKMAMNFDQQMELLHTQAGASQAQVEALKNSVLALAPTVGVGPDQLAEGLYHIASTGADATTWMNTLTQAAHLAKIGMADLDTVTYALSGVMSVGMKDVKSASDAVAFMNAAVGEGDMRMQQLAASIGTGVLPAFKLAGLGMNDFVAALATLADNSTPADEAATRLRMTIALLSAPSGKAEAALKAIGLSQLDAAHALTNRDAELAKFGITVSQLADDMQKPNGLLVAVKDLKAHLAGLSAPEATAVLDKAFGGGRTSGAIETLLTETTLDAHGNVILKLQQKYDQQGTSAQRAAKMQEAWASQQKQFKQQLDQLVATLQAWGIKLGNVLIPKIQEFMGWLSKHKQLVIDLAAVIGGVLVAAMLAWIGVQLVALVTNPFLPVILGVALVSFLIFELVKHWDTVWKWIKQIAYDAWAPIWRDVLHPIEDFFTKKIPEALTALGKGWDTFWSQFGSALRGVWDHTIGPILGWIQDGINAVTGLLNDLTGGGTGANPGTVRGNSMNSGLPHKAMGGTVAGPIGSPQLIVAHGGETVYPPGKGGSSGGGDVYVVATFVTPDGRVIKTETLRAARQSGFANTSSKYLTPANANSIIR